MTKKDFIELADCIKRDGSFTMDQVQVLARFCRTQNSAFMEGRWMDYVKGECGPNGGAVKKGAKV
jgi:hypothetical protein